MNNTALGAENKKEQTINFISEAHEKFYYEKLKDTAIREQDMEVRPLCREYRIHAIRSLLI